MKKRYLIVAAILISATIWAQSPHKISYQAVIRNTENNLVTNQQVGMQISILQGSVSGTAVYLETHITNTNANGLVSIEIGTGTTSDDFTAIDWANGPYFIKTETDPAGGTTYTIIGTSQLLSVPYALHAKTAERITGTIIETDPIFSASQANNITATDITNLGNLSGTNTGDQDLSSLATKTALGDSMVQVRSEIPDVSGFLKSESDPIYTSSQAANITAGDIINLGNLSGVNTGDQDGSETIVTGGTNITVTGTGTMTNPYVLNTTDTLAIGDSYQGGIIFWLDATGQHGLIAATEDQSTSVQWDNGTFRYNCIIGDGLYAGAMNTAIIVAQQIADNQSGDFAAKVCADYSVSVDGVTYGDWYLPSVYELKLLYLQETAVGGFASGPNARYWSSTELVEDIACYLHFINGSQNNEYKYYKHYVRAIRAF
ncbi:hypothetical protein ES705_31306 [subsurface metagenome]